MINDMELKMMKIQKLTLRDASKVIADIAPITITRISKRDSTFPKIERIGRSLFIDSEAFYVWLSDRAGFEVSEPDIAITSKDLQKIFSKSHTWIWQNIKSGVIPRPFKINRSTYWMKSQIDELLCEVAS